MSVVASWSRRWEARVFSSSAYRTGRDDPTSAILRSRAKRWCITAVSPTSLSRCSVAHEGAPAERLAKAKGYSNGISATGRLIFTAAVVGWDETEIFVSDTLLDQFEQALRNIIAILAEDAAGPEHIVRMTCYVTDIHAYRSSLKSIGEAWKATIGRNFPTMALVGVSALVEPKALVEIEATAVVPE